MKFEFSTMSDMIKTNPVFLHNKLQDGCIVTYGPLVCSNIGL